MAKTEQEEYQECRAYAEQGFQKMRALIENSVDEPVFQSLATDIVGKKRGREAAFALWDWTSKNIKYSSDPFGRDVFSSPMATWSTKAGDCEDRTMFIATIALNANLNVKLAYVRFPAVLGVFHTYPVIEGYAADPAWKFGEHFIEIGPRWYWEWELTPRKGLNWGIVLGGLLALSFLKPKTQGVV